MELKKKKACHGSFWFAEKSKSALFWFEKVKVLTNKGFAWPCKMQISLLCCLSFVRLCVRKKVALKRFGCKYTPMATEHLIVCPYSVSLIPTNNLLGHFIACTDSTCCLKDLRFPAHMSPRRLGCLILLQPVPFFIGYSTTCVARCSGGRCQGCVFWPEEALFRSS